MRNEIVKVTRIWQHKTFVPVEVRKILRVDNGDRLLWKIVDGKVIVESTRLEEEGVKPVWSRE